MRKCEWITKKASRMAKGMSECESERKWHVLLLVETKIGVWKCKMVFATSHLLLSILMKSADIRINHNHTKKWTTATHCKAFDDVSISINLVGWGWWSKKWQHWHWHRRLAHLLYALHFILPAFITTIRFFFSFCPSYNEDMEIAFTRANLL